MSVGQSQAGEKLKYPVVWCKTHSELESGPYGCGFAPLKRKATIKEQIQVEVLKMKARRYKRLEYENELA